ncbi:hypothetical protein [uncultured Albimonas sp.]|uniref:hypothetical protein n=1 Tax=uncultured Albimonas sp. TaxID=1331701 RepID=UPI0030EDECDF|tara:strand:- start:35 stop:334 length:300 start_codon:yes stop_codon:yes gene_type:complete
MHLADIPLPQHDARARARALRDVRRRPAPFAFPTPSLGGILAAPGRFWARLRALLRALRRERQLLRGINQLHRLDDRSLRDIGIEDRSAIEALVRGTGR